MEKLRLNETDYIFSTGVFLKPEKCIPEFFQQYYIFKQF